MTVVEKSLRNMFERGYKHGYEDALKKNKGEWIPVSERLPESSGVYIVSRWFSDGEESAILTDANYYDGCGEWYNDNRINWGRELVTDKIVAWQPLPEPYKAESEDI